MNFFGTKKEIIKVKHLATKDVEKILSQVKEALEVSISNLLLLND